METEESTIKLTLFSDYKAAKDGTWFTTRSPYPDVLFFKSPDALKKCSNCSSYMSPNASIEQISQYLKDQVRILMFNNPDHSKWQIHLVFTTRMKYWTGNGILQKDPYYLEDLLDIVIEECFSETDYASKIAFELTNYWYSDKIMLLSGIGKSGSPRFKAKHAARAAVKAEDYIEVIKAASEEYNLLNFKVKPTSQKLKDETGISVPTIKKYGRDYYIHKGENTKQRVLLAKEVYPEYTQNEIAALLNVSKRAVRQYWKIKTAALDTRV